MVEILTVGLAEPGEQYMLNCTVSVVERLIVSPVITWTKRSASNAISVSPVDMVVSDTMRSLSLNFPSLNASDAGQYICEASLNVSEIDMVTSNKSSSDLLLKSKCFYIITWFSKVFYDLKLCYCEWYMYLHMADSCYMALKLS